MCTQNTLGERRTTLFAVDDVEAVREVSDHVLDFKVKPLVMSR